jgi:hypothetical protein
MVGHTTEVFADVLNDGADTAYGVRVNFGVHAYEADVPTFFDIGTRIIDLEADGTPHRVAIPWRPEDYTHQCLKAEIGYGPDTDYSNNIAERNITVAGSPVSFQLRNTYSEEPMQIRLVAEYDDPDCDWPYTIQPTKVILGANDCPQDIVAEIFPPEDAPPGTTHILNIYPEIRTASGTVRLGHVSILKRIPKTE